MTHPVTITGRHMEITEALRDHVTERLEHACKLLDKISSSHVTIAVEKARHIVEILIHANGATLHAKEETHDMYSSIDQAVDKIETQAKRIKEKLKDRKHAAEGDNGSPVGRIEDEVSPSSAQVFVAETFAPKPMSVTEAVETLQSSPDQFVVFHNARNGLVNVLYKRADGSFGLVQPPA